MSQTLVDMLGEDAVARVAAPNGSLHRLPGLVFRDRAFLDLELNAWLARTWLFVGRGADVPEPGDAAPVPGHPYFLVRQKDGTVAGFHNACRHRGHRVLAEPCRGSKSFQCPYHFWTYGLDGRLLSAPHFTGYGKHRVPDGDPIGHGLLPVRTSQWHDWIFINIDGTAEPLQDFLAPMAAKLADVEFGKLRHFLTMHTRRINANWKICLENTMEPYHVPFVHRETAAGQPLSQHYMVEDGPVIGCAIDVPGSDFTNEPGSGAPDNLDMSARYLLRVPNLFLTSYAPDVIIDTMYLPDARDPAVSWLQQAWYTTSGRTLTPAELEAWRVLEDRVMEEDVGIMESVQQGIESVAVDDGGILSPAWETCIAAFYRNLVGELQPRE